MCMHAIVNGNRVKWLWLHIYYAIYIYYIYIMYYIYIYIYIYYIYITLIHQARIQVLKVKSTVTRYIKCYEHGVSTNKNLLKEIESVNNNAPGKSNNFEQVLVGWDEYIYKMKSLKALYTVSWWRTKVSKKD